MSVSSFNISSLRLELLGLRDKENSAVSVNLPTINAPKPSVTEIASAIESAITQLKRVRFSTPMKSVPLSPVAAPLGSKEAELMIKLQQMEMRLEESENQRRSLESELESRDSLIAELQKRISDIECGLQEQIHEQQAEIVDNLMENEIEQEEPAQEPEHAVSEYDHAEAADEYSSPIKLKSPSASKIGLLSPATATAASPDAMEKSAVSIQSAYRSFLERKGIQRERELSELPIASPSRGFGNKRKARLSLINQSPAQSNIKSAEDEQDEVESNSFTASSASVHSDNPGSLALDTHQDDEPSDEQDSESPSSNNHSMISSASVSSAGPASSSSNAKRILAEFKKARAILGDLKNCWTLRVKAMNCVEEIVREGPLAEWDQWPSQLEQFRLCMADQLQDLRSAIVREACRTLIAMAETAPQAFESEVAHYLPVLYKGLYVTIKVISSSCDETIKTLVERVNSVKCIAPLLAGLQDPHNIVREKCGVHLAEYLTLCTDSNALEPFAPDLVQAIRVHIGDSDGATRAAFRQVFTAFQGHFASRAATLFQEFTGTVQRTIQQEADKKGKAKGGRGKKK